MPADQRNSRPNDEQPEEEGYELRLAPGDHHVTGWRPVPFTEADLREALRFAFSDEEAEQFASDLAKGGLDAPGTFWVGDTVLLVALLSPEHEERIREYLGWTPERMAEEVARVRSNYAR
jgi:hypothetical protein